MGRSCCCGKKECENCSDCITSQQFDQDYDYALLICNINAAKDDEFDLYLNNVLLGSVTELGQDVCKGKWFVTNNNAIQIIMNSQNNKCNIANVQPPSCCYMNTNSVELIDKNKKLSFFAEEFNVYLVNKKNNNNGNYGYIGLWRIKKNQNTVCQIAQGSYTGYSGENIRSYLTSSQTLCNCCDPPFDQIIYNIQNVPNIVYNAFISDYISCTPNFGPWILIKNNVFGTQYDFSGCFNQKDLLSPINGTFIFNINNDPNSKCVINGQPSKIEVFTQYKQILSITSDIFSLSICYNNVISGYKQASKLLCIQNPIVYEFNQTYYTVDTSTEIQCNTATYQKGIRNPPIKLTITGVRNA